MFKRLILNIQGKVSFRKIGSALMTAAGAAIAVSSTIVFVHSQVPDFPLAKNIIIGAEVLVALGAHFHISGRTDAADRKSS